MLELETFDKGKRKSNNISLGLELNEVKLENGLYAKGILTKNIKNGLFKVFDSSTKEVYCNSVSYTHLTLPTKA